MLREEDINSNSTSQLSFIVGIGIVAFGLLVSYIGWRTYQTEITIGLGIGIQI